MGHWVQTTPIWLLGLLLFLATVVCAFAGSHLSRWFAQRADEGGKLSEAQEGYVVTSIFALLALLVAFTFGLTMERYEARRQLVVQDATAIETLYLKSQLLDEPHRSRFSGLLIRYAGNHVELAHLRRDDAAAGRLLGEDDAMLRDLWIATVPAFQSIKTIDFSASFVDSVSEVVKVDAERKALRRAQIPGTIIIVLMFYTLVASAVLGGVMQSRKAQQFSIALLALNILALMIITDVNRPVEGTIRESQEPMERMLERLKANPPPVYQPAAYRAPQR
jgi:hypothetical protein